MTNYELNKKIFIDLFSECIIIDEIDKTFGNFQIINKEMYKRNGQPFTFASGQKCAIVTYNAFSKKSLNKVTEAFISDDLSQYQMFEFILKNRAREWISDTHPGYNNWKVGDTGTITMENHNKFDNTFNFVKKNEANYETMLKFHNSFEKYSNVGQSNYGNSYEEEFQSDNIWEDVFGPGDEADTAYWNTD